MAQDRWGDPLPEGAVARLGTIRLRHPGGVWALLLTDDAIYSAGEDGYVCCWERSDGRLRWKTEVSASAQLALAIGDGSLAVGGVGGGLVRLDPGSGSVQNRVSGEVGAVGVICPVADTWILGSDDSGRVRRVGGWEVDVETNSIRAMSISPDGTRVGLVGEDGAAAMLEIGTGRVLKRWPAHRAGAVDCGWIEDRFFTAGSDGKQGKLLCWDPATGKQSAFFRPLEDPLAALAIAGTNLLVVSEEGDLMLYDGTSAEVAWHYDELNDPARRIVTSPDGSVFAVAGESGVIRVWETEGAQRLYHVPSHDQEVYGLAFTSDGLGLVSCGEDATVRAWDPDSTDLLWTGVGHEDRVYAVAPVGRMFVSGGFDGALCYWNAHAGESDVLTPARVIEERDGIHALALCPETHRLATGHATGTIRVREAASGELEHEFLGQWEQVLALAFSPNGGLLASGGVDTEVRIWNTGTGQREHLLTDHENWVIGLGFDAGMLLSVDALSIRAWNPMDGVPRYAVRHEEDEITAAAFAPGILALGTASGRIEFRSTGDATLLREFTGHLDRVLSIAFSPNGDRIVSGDGIGQILVWELG